MGLVPLQGPSECCGAAETFVLVAHIARLNTSSALRRWPTISRFYDKVSIRAPPPGASPSLVPCPFQKASTPRHAVSALLGGPLASRRSYAIPRQHPPCSSVKDRTGRRPHGTRPSTPSLAKLSIAPTCTHWLCVKLLERAEPAKTTGAANATRYSPDFLPAR